MLPQGKINSSYKVGKCIIFLLFCCFDFYQQTSQVVETNTPLRSRLPKIKRKSQQVLPALSVCVAYISEPRCALTFRHELALFVAFITFNCASRPRPAAPTEICHARGADSLVFHLCHQPCAFSARRPTQIF